MLAFRTVFVIGQGLLNESLTSNKSGPTLKTKVLNMAMASGKLKAQT